jgi:hypothetical protein
MSRGGKTTVISLGLHPSKKAQFFCHGCRKKYDGHIEYSRLKVLYANGSCATMRTYCQVCTEEVLQFEKTLNMENENNNLSEV